MARSNWFCDTHPRALEVLIRRQREMTVSEKLEAVLSLNAFVRRLQEAGEREMHPDADDREIFLRAASRRLDRDTMIRAYRWDPATASGK